MSVGAFRASRAVRGFLNTSATSLPRWATSILTVVRLSCPRPHPPPSTSHRPSPKKRSSFLLHPPGLYIGPVYGSDIARHAPPSSCLHVRRSSGSNSDEALSARQPQPRMKPANPSSFPTLKTVIGRHLSSQHVAARIAIQRRLSADRAYRASSLWEFWGISPDSL